MQLTLRPGLDLFLTTFLGNQLHNFILYVLQREACQLFAII